MKLNKQQIDIFEKLLEKESPEDSLSYIEVHGLLSGLNVGPIQINLKEKIKLILWGEIPKTRANPCFRSGLSGGTVIETASAGLAGSDNAYGLAPARLFS